METRIYSIRWLAIFLFALMVIGRPVEASEVSASTSLSYEQATVGEAVELNVTVEGVRSSKAPEIRVDGLHIQYVGPQSRIEMNNFDVRSSVTHSYMVIPQRAGTFTIPALKMEVGGKSLTTKPVKLVVQGGRGASPKTAGPTQSGEPEPDADTRLAFAEWVVPKNTAYVGETIPAELRLYVATEVRMSLQQLPSVSGDGFTVASFPKKPSINRITRDGRSYELVIFKTALTAAKVGALKLEPTEINAVVEVQRRRNQRPRGLPDVFNDPFFDSAFGTVTQPVMIKADGLEMEIKPLPAGRPKGFSGAIGQFTLATEASPLQVKAGDPVTVTAKVSGVGNFDRMGAPVADTGGWKAYPPSSKFNAEDEIGISGEKTFEFAMISDRPQSALPRIEFSFFDPAKEQYVTLTGDPIAVTVEGAAVPAPTPASSMAAAPQAPASAEKESRANDILFIRTDAGAWGSLASFEPLWRSPVFLYGQLLPLAALLIGAGWRWRSARLGDVRARRIAELRQEKTAAVQILSQSNVTTDRFHSAAVRALRLEAALRDPSLNPETLDAEAICALGSPDGETAASIRSLFAAHDELQYAGAGASREPVSPDRRNSVLTTLKQFEKSHA